MGLSNIKFSIIIPVYNLELYISKCLESLLNQSYNNWEAIIINDGSIDNSIEIINCYKDIDSRFKIINKENEGLSAARNEGILKSKGDFIIFLDGDDWFEENALNNILFFLNKHNPEVLVHNMNYFFSKNKIVAQNTKIQEALYEGVSFLHEVLINKEYFHFVAPSKVYKREFIENYNLFFQKGIIHEDGPFFFNVCKEAKKIYYTKKIFYYYRQDRDGSITSKNSIKNFNGIIFGLNKQFELFEFKDKIVNGSSLNLFTFLVSNYDSKEDKKLAFKILRSHKYKLIIFKLIFNSKTSLNVYIKGILLLIDPLLLSIIYDFYFTKK